ncbi:hypothetical protein [Inquilinus sp.]|jgi:hypothetical protein|uniref:hypothetical protein n=1 Tax=Inquilinus sp. TaxID=1932117 RepID=UPI0037836BB6
MIIVGALIVTAWISLLAGIVGGLCWHAYRLEGVALLTRRFLAELVTAALLFSAVIWGVPLAGAAFGIGQAPTIQTASEGTDR